MGYREDWDEATKAAPNFPGMEPAEQQPDKAYLIVLSGTRLGSMVEVRDGMIIGRSQKTDLPIPEDGVSRQHVRIRATPEGQLVAEDMDSLNGTFVNGERIESIVLIDGDKIRIGTTTILKFSYADPLEENFQNQMRDAALHDPLTKIFNRRFLDEHVAREVAFAWRHGSALSLVLFDIDHFKLVNDTHGHPVGDELLSGLAAHLTRQIRQEDILARYGGEEFALLCRGINGQVAYSVADRLRQSVVGQPLVPRLEAVRITLSGGVAAMPSGDIETERGLVEAADEALYRAKGEGRNRVFLHQSTPLPPTPRRPSGASLRRPPSAPPLPPVESPAEAPTGVTPDPTRRGK